MALSWAVIACAVVLTIVLGFIGFSGTGGESLPFTTRLYLSLQLLTMESGSLTDLNEIGWTLEIARWAGVVAAFGTIFNTLLTLFAARIRSFLMRRMSKHAVIVGAGQAGSQLAADLLADGYRVIVIDVDETNSAMPALIQRGADELIGDARDMEILEAAAVAMAEIVIVVAGTDARNLEIAAAINNVCSGRDPDSPPLRCYLHLIDRRLHSVRDSTVLQSNTEVFCPLACRVEEYTFDRFTNGARLLLAHSPLDRSGISPDDPHQVHLVLVNLTAHGEALLTQSLAIGHFANNIPLAVTVIDEAASKKQNALACRIPELDQLGQLRFIDGSVRDKPVRDHLDALLNDSGLLVSLAVCSDDSQKALQEAMDLLPLLTDFNNTVYVTLGDDDEAMNWFAISAKHTIRLVPFGNTSAACSAEAVLRSHLDTLAQRIHEMYVARRLKDGASPEQYPAMRPWNELTTELQDMNRQQADHIPVKLRALGLRMLPAASVERPSLPELGTSQVEAVAITEHNRWCASRRLTGWKYGAVRDDAQKIHPDLVPWSELEEAQKEYDRDPVRSLPDILKEIGFAVAPVEH